MSRRKGDDRRSGFNLSDSKAPPLGGVLETVLYVENLQAADAFYSKVLGLKKIFEVPGRQLVFRCDNSFVLLFNPAATERNQIQINGGLIPLHGSRGPGHVALRASKRRLSAWRRRLNESGVSIESEVAWPNGAHSIYFRDPAGNSLELATPDMWKNSKP